ncbi:MAG: hypothetical protein ACLUE8_02525 [Lachnospiraceae bacterium]
MAVSPARRYFITNTMNPVVGKYSGDPERGSNLPNAASLTHQWLRTDTNGRSVVAQRLPLYYGEHPEQDAGCTFRLAGRRCRQVFGR